MGSLPTNSGPDYVVRRQDEIERLAVLSVLSLEFVTCGQIETRLRRRGKRIAYPHRRLGELATLGYVAKIGRKSHYRYALTAEGEAFLDASQQHSPHIIRAETQATTQP